MAIAEREVDYLGMLNPAQREAAAFGSRQDDGGFAAGPLLVIAGAGTGKTMTLAHRVAHLVIEGTSPERILLLTFTRRAANEMIRRVESIVRRSLGADGAGVVVLDDVRVVDAGDDRRFGKAHQGDAFDGGVPSGKLKAPPKSCIPVSII